MAHICCLACYCLLLHFINGMALVWTHSWHFLFWHPRFFCNNSCCKHEGTLIKFMMQILVKLVNHAYLNLHKTDCTGNNSHFLVDCRIPCIFLCSLLFINSHLFRNGFVSCFLLYNSIHNKTFCPHIYRTWIWIDPGQYRSVFFSVMAVPVFWVVMILVTATAIIPDIIWKGIEGSWVSICKFFKSIPQVSLFSML